MAGELIGREALERIIQRAAELQAGERDIGEGLTEPDLLALGQEVGIPPRYLRQALLEERTRSEAVPERGLVAWLAGPVVLSADRVVPGDPATVERVLRGWMEREESLQVKRRHTDRTSWEPRVGAIASLQRALSVGGKSFALAHTTEVAAQVTPLEPGFCHVRLTASVRAQRGRRLWGAATVVAIGAALAAVTSALGVQAPAVLLPPLVLWAVALAAARRHRRDNERIAVGLEQVLDRLERGEIGPDQLPSGTRANAFVRLAVEIRKTIKPI
jgi:hypothetical protein